MVIYLKPILVFIYGYTLGVLLAYLVFTTKHPNRVFPWNSNEEIEDSGKKLTTNLLLNNEFTQVDSDNLKNQVLVLCVMFVNNINNAYVSSYTWMWKCNHQLYFGLKKENYLKVMVMKPSNSWHYLCNVFRHIFHTFRNRYHWILFSKDNDFVIPDNLRQSVISLNYSDTYYLGHEALFWNVYFNSGRSSYVVSKGTVDALMKKFTTDEECKNSGQYWSMEDYYLGKHLAQLGIYPSDTRDTQHRIRFHVAPMNFLFKPVELGKMSDYDSRSVYKEIQGAQCCSPMSISFPVSSISSMYFFDYLIHTVRLCKDAGMINSSFIEDQVWKKFVLEVNPKANLSHITAEKYYEMWKDFENGTILNKQKDVTKNIFKRERRFIALWMKFVAFVH